MRLAVVVPVILWTTSAVAQTQPLPRTPCSRVIPTGASVDENRVVRDRSGQVIADYSADGCTPPATAAVPATLGAQAQAGAAATSPSPGPFEEFSLVYLDESQAPMFSGALSSFQVPMSPPASSADQAFRWASRIFGTPTGSTDSNAYQFLEAGVSYGPWPDVPGTTAGAYYAWAALRQDQNWTFYSTPFQVGPGALIEVSIKLTGFRQPNPPINPPEVAMYDPATYLLWDLMLTVNGNPIPTLSASTLSLGKLSWDSIHTALMSIYNVPGSHITSCADALPPSGAIVFGPLMTATSDVHAPNMLNWSAPQNMVRYGTLAGTPGLACDPWGGDNVTISSPSTVLLTWPTTSTLPSPPPPPVVVPAVGFPTLLGLAAVLAAAGALAVKKRRRTT
jgi:hypothetical protein